MANEYRFTTLAGEVVNSGAAVPLVTTLGAEVVHAGAALPQIATVAVEVVRSIATSAVAARRRQLVNG